MVFASRSAHADDAKKQQCIAGFEGTQTLRRDGQLRAAREAALSCMEQACPAFAREQCGKWLSEIDASLPTVVLDVRGKDGQPATAVAVSLDGKPWLTSLDGRATPIDPGKHALHFTIDGAPPLDQSVTILEGEKNKRIAASFAPEQSSASGTGNQSRSIAPWILGGAGLAALAVGGVTGALVLSQKSTWDQHCSPATETCDATGIAAASSIRSLGPVSTIGLVAGGATVAGAAIWILATPASKTAVGFNVGPGRVNLGMEGTW